MKHLLTGFILFLFISVCGQKPVHDSLRMYYQDSLMISKSFVSNHLTVKVINPCNAEKERFDGAVTIINAAVKSKNYSDSMVYSYPYAQSGFINLKAGNLSGYTVNKYLALLIPFTYCGNWDNDTKVSYMIFYKRKKYLYHISYRCKEEGRCTPNEDLNRTLKDLPSELKLRVIKDLQTKYNTSNDFY